MALYFQHQPEIRWLLHAVVEIHYDKIKLSVSSLSFLYINPQCLTDVRQAMRALSLMTGFQVDNRCNSKQRQNFILCLHVQTNLVVHPTSCRRALGS